jgi:outer membrane protein assembly factor BamD (BamD/ComL family)
MNRWLARVFLIAVGLLAFPQRSPAPLIYTPGEGWVYESVGGGKWQRTRAKDQLEVAQQAFDIRNFGLAMKASKRVVSQWPFSDYAPKAQYLLARCQEARTQDEAAFKSYEKLLTKYPKIDNYNEIIQRQYEIANRFLAGQRFRLFNTVPLYKSMEKTIKMYERTVAPDAQLKIGDAYERKKNLFLKAPDYMAAAKAYERAADRYPNLPQGADGLYRTGVAYSKEAKRADYDQTVAGQAIAAFTDFRVVHPEDARVPQAEKAVAVLKVEQARGSFEVARYYESKKRLDGALIYYNDVLLKAPESQYAQQARERIEQIKKRQLQVALKPLPAGMQVPSLKNAEPQPAPPLTPSQPAKP